MSLVSLQADFPTYRAELMLSCSTSFSRRFMSVSEQRSPFCLGLDPTPNLLQAWNLPDNLSGLQEFERLILPHLSSVALIKPQCAFYERFGPEGLRVLQSTIQAAHEVGTLVLADCKKGDISHTLLGYAQAYLGPESAFKADAMTLTAYLGIDAIHDVLAYAKDCGAGLFIVVRSSNIEGRFVQQAKLPDGREISEFLADKITEMNQRENTDFFGPVGAVIGATLAEDEIQNLLPRLSDSLILTPGLGAQGASYEDIKRSFKGALPQVVPTSSRAVLKQGPTYEGLANAIETEKLSAMSLRA